MVSAPYPSGRERFRHALDRTRRLVRARGLFTGLACAIVPALLWRLRIHLFVSYRHPGSAGELADGSEAVERVTGLEGLSEADRAALREYGGDALLARIECRFAHGDWAAVARRGGALACCCFVHETSTYPPGGAGAVAFLQSAFTLPRFRGAGHFPRTLAFVARALERERPGLPVYVEASLDNLSSRRAIEKAGFVRAGLRVTSPLFQRWYPARSRSAPQRAID